jgi:hypothetical protein
LCSNDAFDASFFLEPSLHDDDLPRLLEIEPPKWLLLGTKDRDAIVDELYVVLSVPPHEILVIALGVDSLGEESRLDVLSINHTELREESGQVLIVVSQLEVRFLEVILGEDFELLIVEFVDPAERVFAVRLLQVDWKVEIAEDCLFAVGHGTQVGLPAALAEGVKGAGLDLADLIVLLPGGDGEDVVGALLKHDLNG